MSLSNNFPDIKPSLNLDFANTKQLDPRITFTRTTTATYYNGVTTAKAEENLLLQSQALATSPWGATNVTVTNNTGDTTAPDGTSTATKIALNASSGVAKWVRQDQTSLSSVVVSFHLKQGTHSIVQIYAEGNSGNYCNFDLNAGTVGNAGANATGSIVALPNDWYRCIVVFGATAGGRTYISAVDSTSAAFAATTTAVSVDFYAWGAQREQRSAVSSYTPTTTQPITNYIPVLQTAASGVARFDHNPTTGESLGLLVEEQRTNLLERSEEFDNAYWSKSNSSITANTIVAPDGTLTGDKLVENTTSNAHNTFRQVTGCVNGDPYTFSVYVKAGERSAIQMAQRDSGFVFQVAATFNIDTQVITVTTGSPTTSITSVGNGWYRCSITGNANGTTVGVLVALSNGSITNYTGDGYSGVYIWGAQLEAGAFPTSYIATTSASVTRNLDAASMTGTNFTSWFNNAEGTVYSESQLSRQASIAGTGIVETTDGTVNYIMRILYRASGASGAQVTNNTTQADLTPTSTITANQTFKNAFAYKVNDIADSGNAETVVTDTSATIPVVNQMNIGQIVGLAVLNGYIKKLAYYPSRLANAQLQALTS